MGKLKIPDAKSFLLILGFSMVFLFIPLFLSIVINEWVVMLPFLLFYLGMLFFGMNERSDQRNEILIRIMTPIFSISFLFLLGELFYLDLKHGIIVIVKNKNYLFINFICGLSTYTVFKLIFTYKKLQYIKRM